MYCHPFWEACRWWTLGYGKDCFLRQPYEPLKSQKPLLHHIHTITYEKSFIRRVDFFSFCLAFAFFWASIGLEQAASHMLFCPGQREA